MYQNAYAIAFYHTVSSEAFSDKSGSRERFADAVFGAVVAVDELSGKVAIILSQWEVLKMKKETMPTEVIEEEVTEETTMTYDLPINPNTKTTVILDDSEDEANKAEKEVEPSSSKQAKSNLPPLKAYKPKIPYP
ncbi:hypothetical protein Tco_0072626 [Tanacetum coccineum]